MKMQMALSIVVLLSIAIVGQAGMAAAEQQVSINALQGDGLLLGDDGTPPVTLSIKFKENVPTLDLKTYGYPKGNWNDRAKSVAYRIPAGWYVVLYENRDYGKDECGTLSGEGVSHVNCFGLTSIGLKKD